MDAESSDQIDEDIKKYFSDQKWDEMSSYEKLRYSNVKRNYEMLMSLGLKPKPPNFMNPKQKVPFETCVEVKNHREDSEEDEDEPQLAENKEPTEKETDNETKLEAESTTKTSFRNHRKVLHFKKTVERVELSSDDEEPIQDRHENTQKDSGKSGRYPKRNISRKYYKEEDLSSEDEFVYCEDCGTEYDGPCPVHGPMSLVVNKKVPKDGSVQQRALKTLPHFLSVGPSSIRKAGLGVWTETLLPPRVVFGPYEGRIVKNHKEAHKTGYSWQIWKGGRAHHYVEASEDSVSNWLRFVNCAEGEERQNLVAFQYRKKIYYRTYKPVQPHTELLVWYGDQYARELGIDMTSSAEDPFKDLECHACDVCGRLFTDAHTLNRHKKRHPHMEPDRGHKCHFCPYSCKCQSHLRRHLSTHTGQRPHDCHHCRKAFTTKGALTRHLRLHSGEKPFTCDVCHRAFSYTSSLRSHEISVHSKLRPYLCSVCGKSFAQRSSRLTHELTHSGRKPYRCEKCDRRFGISSNLRSHVARIHTRVFPHQCLACGKGFLSPKELRIHAEKHHPEK